MTDKLRVRKSPIKLTEELTLDTYTADQIDDRGIFVNYLSGRGTSNAVKTARSTVVVKTMSKELKAFLGKEFTVVQGEYKMVSGGVTPVSLWKLDDVIKYWGFWAFKATRVKKESREAAQNILLNASLSLFQVMTDEAFGREYTPGKAQKLLIANNLLKTQLAESQHNAASWKYLHDQAQKDLQYLSEDFASPDHLEAENEYLKRILRQNGIDPYAA